MKNKDLFSLSVTQKEDYLKKVIYEKITTSGTGRTMIPTAYLKKVAELLGGDYDSLSKVQKDIFRSDVCLEQISIERGFFYNLI